MEHEEDNQGGRSAEAEEDPDVDQLAGRAAAMQLESAASLTPRSPGLRLQIPNPFEQMSAEETDEAMATASPYAGGQSVAAAPAFLQPPRFQGRTMQDRRIFKRQYDTYLGTINALQTQWGGAFAMPVGACIESRTKRMVARQANTPSHIDYTSVDEAMKKIQMKTPWFEPESRMMNLQADLEAILDKFNLTDVAFKHEQRRIVKYLANALAPTCFKAVIVTKLTHENKTYKDEVVPFCSRVTKLMRSSKCMEQNHQQQRSSNRGNTGGRGASGGHGQGGRRGKGGGSGGGDRSGANDNRGGYGGRAGGDVARALQARGSTGARAAGASDEDTSERPSHGACMKCRSMDHQVRDCPSCQPSEATRLLQALRERREATLDISVRRFAVVEPEESPMQQEDADDDRGAVAADVDGQAVTALLLDSGADTSLVACGVLDELRNSGKDVPVRMVDGVRLNPMGGHEIQVQRQVTFKEVVLTTSAGPLMPRNLACYVEEDNASLELTVGRPVMNILGYWTDKLLAKAKDARSEWEVGDLQQECSGEEVPPTALQRVCRLQVLDRDPLLTAEASDDVERYETRTSLPTIRPTTPDEVVLYLEKKVEVTTEMDLTLDGRVKLHAILHYRVDCFQLEFGNDLPVKVAPMQVRLKPDAQPVRDQPRCYSPNDPSLLEHGLVFKNHRSRWASAPRIVRKREQDTDPTADPRITIDTRDDILGYAESEEALLEVLDKVLERCAAYGLKLHAKKCQFFATERVGSHKQTQLAKVRLEDIGWGDQEIAGVEDARTALLGMVPLAYPSPTADVCLYTDAGQDFWGAVVTQLEPHEVSLPLDKQNHRPLTFLSGRFVGAVVRWSTIEKEARWGAGQDQPADRAGVRGARLAVVERVSPLVEPDFVWPTEAQIKELQQHAQDAGADLQGAQWSDERQLMVTPAGQVWIPADSHEIQQRLYVIAHAGASGPRRKGDGQGTVELFVWPTLTKDVALFVNGCLHSMMTAEDRMPRPFGETLKAIKPNKLLHFDYLTMIEGNNGMSGRRCAAPLHDVLHAVGQRHRNREILNCVRALLSERKPHVRDWPAVLPVVQAALNGMPADRLNGVTPLTEFRALPGGAPDKTRSDAVLHARGTRGAKGCGFPSSAKKPSCWPRPYKS
uniref:Reverse transcriptase/retrotransposon-derived protein RNase H-like domain-containing protein n=1 Tax=Phytophthora ramorum TaxID=164328 RepID=H3GQQ9_PHYRM